MKNKIIIIVSSIILVISIISVSYLYFNGNIFKLNKMETTPSGYTEVTVPTIKYDDINDWHDAWIGIERVEEYISMDALPGMIQSLIVGEPSRGIPLACIYIGLGFTEEDSVEYIDAMPIDPNDNDWIINGISYNPSHWVVNGEDLLILQECNDESKVLYKPYWSN